MSTDRIDIRYANKALEQYYRNSRYNIEDPLFTGFTFDIDTLHSPLFYALAGTEYKAAETLRSAGGTDTTLSKIIEQKLSDVYKFNIVGSPDSYEINTLHAKDELSSMDRRKVGYGLWDKYYIDNVLYGAVDYIYMVDKVSVGTYEDDFGVTDVGNGTPDSNVYKNYTDTLNDLQNQAVNDIAGDQLPTNQHVDIFFDLEQHNIRSDQEGEAQKLLDFLLNNPGSNVNLEGYASKDKASYEHNMNLSKDRVNEIKDYLVSNGIDPSRITTSYYGDTVQPFDENIMNRAVTCMISGVMSPESVLEMEIDKRENDITDADFNEHIDNEGKYNTAKLAYEVATMRGDETTGEGASPYRQKQAELKTLELDIDSQRYGLESELADLKSEMEKYLAILKGNNSKDEARQQIASIYSKYRQLVDYFKNNADNSEYKEKYSYIDASFSVPNEKDVQREVDNERLTDEQKQTDEQCYRQAYEVIKTAITEKPIKDTATTKRAALKEEISNFEKQIYGVHPGGRIGTESDPAPGSICYDFQQAKVNMETDVYSTATRKIEEMKDIYNNLDDIQRYNEVAAGKNTTIQRTMPSIDYAVRTDESGSPVEDLAAYENRIRNMRDSRITYEVPQTVYDMMGFINGMLDITSKYPYVLQTVTGLDEAYKKYFDLKDPYMGSGDGKISFECLEFLDMRVSSMFNKYFNAVYDRQYRRERVPINLRRFNCSVFVHDIRNFKNSLNFDRTVNSGDYAKIVELALQYVSAIEFKFYDCEIVPDETGGIFESVTNLPNNDMRKTHFTFKYGNCVINFFPFEDLRRYLLQKDVDNIKPGTTRDEYSDNNFNEDYLKITENPIINKMISTPDSVGTVDDGNFRRWFDRSELGNVNNNDYRDYIRHDSAVAVDDHFKTAVVNNFAMNSVVNKNKELTALDDALRRIVVGISASTGIPVKGVVDALDVRNIEPYLTQQDLDTPVTKKIGNVNNSTVVDVDTMDYIGEVDNKEKEKPTETKDLGKVDNEEKEKPRPTNGLGAVDNKE